MTSERLRAESMNPLPFIKLWGTLLVPLQGEVTDDLAGRIHEEVLHLVHESEVESVIIDITGLWLLDSHICAMLAALGASTKLMGARTVICGMSAEIAQTLQMMDIGLDSVESALNVEEAFELIGLRVQRRAANPQLELDGVNDELAHDTSGDHDEPLEER
jgi:rsbT antagonist protein RsbS